MPSERTRSALFFALLLALPAQAWAGDQFGGFRDYVDRGSLKPFTRDLGGLLGAAAFHSGRTLGFSGFDIGLRGGYQFSPSRGDEVLRRAGVKGFGLPWVQAEIGLPFRMDGFIRGVSFQGVTISGGGLRWGFPKRNDLPNSPNFLLSGVAHSVVHRDFSANQYGMNLVASMGPPAFTPYFGAGFDRTRVVVRDSLLDPTLAGEGATTLEGRLTAGFSVRPHRFVYLHAAYTHTHGRGGADCGLGVRF
ncbi:MAG: hypothetical protein AAB412_06670 [Elusimicrobiota bacterium]